MADRACNDRSRNPPFVWSTSSEHIVVTQPIDPRYPHLQSTLAHHLGPTPKTIQFTHQPMT